MPILRSANAAPLSRTQILIWSAVLIVAMVVHTCVKIHLGTLPELLWGCNVATCLIIVGLLTRNTVLVGACFLWHLCLGDPAFFIETLRSGHAADLFRGFSAGWSSVVVHSLPTLAAFRYLRRTGIHWGSPFVALLMFIVLVPLSHYLTPPAFNVNMTFVRFQPLRDLFPGNWSYRFVFSSAMLAVFLAGFALTRLLMGAPNKWALNEPVS